MRHSGGRSRRWPRGLPARCPSGRASGAFVRLLDGVLYVCPWSVRLRSWQALDELRASMPVALLDTVLPQAVRADAVLAQARWQAGTPTPGRGS